MIKPKKVFRVRHFKYGLFVSLFLVILGFGFYYLNSFKLDAANAAAAEINPGYKQNQELNVLVVEVNPHLWSLPGTPKAADAFFGEGTAELVVQEQIDDFIFASHGYINKVNTTWEYIDDFPHYTVTFERPDGTYANQFDEPNYLAASSDGSGGYSWWSMYNNGWFNGVKIPSYKFDYDWLISEADLVNKKNNGEFDQVWLVAIDPNQTFETMMVGRTAYWINGTPYTRNCDNFMIASVSTARRDAQFHAMAHAQENIMKDAYGLRYDPYTENSINISSAEDYMNLNPWERFMLNDYANIGTLNGVGTVHHPFNGTYGYDYSNTANVRTTYPEWRDKSLEEMTGADTIANNTAWMSEPYAIPDFNEGGKEDRFYIRFWFYLMPHEDGFTSDGYLKNWWKYYYSMDYVTSITASKTSFVVDAGDILVLDYNLNFVSGKTQSGRVTADDTNISISNTDVLRFKNGSLKADSYGSSTITLYRDGKSITFTVTVVPTYSLAFDTNGGSEVTTQTCQPVTSTTVCTVMIPATEPTKNGYTFFGYATSQNSEIAAFEAGDEYTFQLMGLNRMLYAIFRNGAVTWTSDSQYVKGGSDTLKLAVDFPRNAYQSATVDGNLLSSADYTVSSSASEFTIKNSFLESLADGSHTLALNYERNVSKVIAFTVVSLPTYTLRYEDDIEPIQTCQGTSMTATCSVTIPAVAPTRENYYFFGYALTSGVETAAYRAGDVFTFTTDQTDITLYPIFRTGELTWQTEQEHEKNTDVELIVRIDFPRFALMQVLVDDEAVDATNYVVSTGSTIILLKKVYLNSLTVGEHTLKAEFINSAIAETIFTITAASDPDPTPIPGPASDDDEEDIKVPDTGCNTSGTSEVVLMGTPVLFVIITTIYCNKHKKYSKIRF